MKFNIGDKVRVIKAYSAAIVGDEGIIKALPGENGCTTSEFKHCYAVEFPDWIIGHECGGKVPYKKGQWVPPECLELIEERKPRIGDRIEMVTDRDGAKKGMTGTIIRIVNFGLRYAVRFDKPFIGSHSCDGACESDRGHWCGKKDFKVIAKEERKIVITSDGKTTTAKFYNGKEIVTTAEAKCSPEDEFDFAIGAKLAFERLMGEEKKEGLKSHKVADLSEFWRGQKNICLLDANILACRQHMELLQQLADSALGWILLKGLMQGL